MSHGLGGEGAPRRRGRSLPFSILGVLVIVACAAIGGLGWKGREALDEYSALRYDNVNWAFSQLAAEALRLQLAAHEFDDANETNGGELVARYELFVSRVSFIHEAAPRNLMHSSRLYAPVAQALSALVDEVDAMMAAGQGARPVARVLLSRLAPLRADMQSLASEALGAASLRLDEHRRKAMDLNHHGLLAVVAEIALVLAFAGAIARQLGETEKARGRSEAVAADLQRAKVAAEAANHAKSAFLATMSHELRTPLNAVIGFSDMMAEEVFGPIGNRHYAEYVQDIRSSGQHLLAIINDILDMAKIESGKLEMAEDVFELAPLIDEALRLLRERARAAGIELSLAICMEPPVIHGDRQLIRQVLLNLYSNALKFTPPGGLVRTEVDCRPDGSVVTRITDTGIGIAREDLERVMQPFVQVENHLSRQHDGTGLGLPLVKAMVELHGGTFELDSVLGAGTTATITLPACRLSRLLRTGPETRVPAPVALL